MMRLCLSPIDYWIIILNCIICYFDLRKQNPALLLCFTKKKKKRAGHILILFTTQTLDCLLIAGIWSRHKACCVCAVEKRKLIKVFHVYLGAVCGIGLDVGGERCCALTIYGGYDVQWLWFGVGWSGVGRLLTWFDVGQVGHLTQPTFNLAGCSERRRNFFCLLYISHRLLSHSDLCLLLYFGKPLQ